MDRYCSDYSLLSLWVLRGRLLLKEIEKVRWVRVHLVLWSRVSKKRLEEAFAAMRDFSCEKVAVTLVVGRNGAS